MLAILVTHPIQYHVPLWQLLARDGRVPFEVWYLSQHATQSSRDREFQQNFAWDLDMLEGYPHRFLRSTPGATPNTPLRSRIADSLPDLFRETETTVLWVQGWQVAAYWQAVWAAQKAGIQVWLRGESNAMAPMPLWKSAVKRPLLGAFFRRVDHFLCIGTANRELYRSYGVPEERLHMAPYAVDNERFQRQAKAIRSQRSVVRSQWSIPQESFCVLFCGKFIPKKRPMDLVKAAQLLLTDNHLPNIHLLFAGSGELGAQLRAHCNVVFDAESQHKPDNQESITDNRKPAASFAGFLNQTEISRAYVTADVLVLPSDYAETWGLVVNEAMASGLSCIISDRCGSASDLGVMAGNSVFPCGKVDQLAKNVMQAAGRTDRPTLHPHTFDTTVETVNTLCQRFLSEAERR